MYTFTVYTVHKLRPLSAPGVSPHSPMYSAKFNLWAAMGGGLGEHLFSEDLRIQLLFGAQT